MLSDIHVAPCAGLTLVLACRSMSKAEAARKELFVALDEELARRKRGPGYDGHGDMFRANLQIDLQYIDMAAMGSVFQAANELALKCVTPSLRAHTPSHSHAFSDTLISRTSSATQVSPASVI